MAVDNEQRRARIGARHRLGAPAADPRHAVEAMLALHSSDPATVFLSTRARVAGFTPPDLENALYQERALVRFYGMRRTLWVIDKDTVPLVHNSSTRVIGQRERARTIRIIEDGGVSTDGAAWLDEVLPKTISAIRAGGEVLARDLTRLVPELRDQITFYNRAGRLMGSTGMSTRALFQLALESRVVRANPVGTWISSQYRWAETETWLRGAIADMSSEESSSELLRLWLTTFGPGTETDIKWWTGWPLRQVRQALTDLGAVEVTLDQGTGYLLPEDTEPMAIAEPWVALLPSLDPTTMGWKERDWYLGGHASRLFDVNGNAGPTIWVDGRVVGGWAQRKDGRVVYEVFDDIGSEADDAVAKEAAALQGWLGETRVTPRFRSPHDKTLAV